MVRLVWFPEYMDWERRKYTWEIRGQTRTFAERGHLHNVYHIRSNNMTKCSFQYSVRTCTRRASIASIAACIALEIMTCFLRPTDL